ncbi:MAG: SRPBCC domain-containing protein [Saprospiraceae bacterium]|nr:SRPBCC domain-containing protein [Saprospiraceae bacterium]
MDWSQFNRKIRIKAPMDQVYKAWADLDKISTWFLKSAVLVDSETVRSSVQKGDKVEWRWYNYENPSIVEIKQSNGSDQMVFTFGYGMEVRIELSREDEYTLLSLTQYNIPTGEESRMNFHVGCRQAWSTWMLNLKSWLEHDILLHDKDLGERKDLFDFVNT